MSSYPVGLIIFLLLISLARFLTRVLLIGGRTALSWKREKKKVRGGRVLNATAQQFRQIEEFKKKGSIWRKTRRKLGFSSSLVAEYKTAVC